MEWMNNGSFMVFRRLNQLVPEFSNFILDQAKNIQLNEPGRNLGVDPVLLGARLVGRWKSGAPMALTPSQDDTTLGADPNQNNNFDFSDDPANAVARTPRTSEKEIPERISTTSGGVTGDGGRSSPHYSSRYSLWAGGEPNRAIGQHDIPGTRTDVCLLSNVDS